MTRWVLVAMAGWALAACGGGPPPKAAAKGAGRRSAVMGPGEVLDPRAVDKMVQGVKLLADASQKKEATELFRSAILLDPRLWEARYDLGVTLASSGDLPAAEEALTAAKTASEGAPEVVLALAEVQKRRGEWAPAEETLRDYVSAHPKFVATKHLYVAVLRGAGHVDRSIEEAREWLVQKPGDPTALAELALSHLAKGERDTAELLAKQALAADGKNAVAERAMGLVLLQRGDDAAAFRSFFLATEDDPHDTTARLNMGAVLLRAGAYDKAEEQYRAIAEVAPEDVDASIGLAAALRGGAATGAGTGGGAKGSDAKKIDEAKGLLEKVLARDPRHVAALYNYAVLSEVDLKKPDQAVAHYKRYLEAAPKDHPARSEAAAAIARLEAPKGAK